MVQQLTILTEAAGPVAAEIDRSAIEWTGATWNPWQGCTKVSDGCKFCYMYTDKKRYGKDPSICVESAPATFLKPLKWQREVDAGRRVGNDRLVFTCSWSDWFIEDADEWRAAAWNIIRKCPGLIFQILTKRPERIADHLPPFWDEIAGRCWLGTSIENQKATSRISHLARIPAVVHFLSIEPLLSMVDIGEQSVIDWVIVGGESGPNARACDIDWIRSIVGQCKYLGIPCFVKQLGARPTLDYYHDDDSLRNWASDGRSTVWAAATIGHFEWRDGPTDGQPRKGSYFERHLSDRKGGDISEFPESLRVRQFPAALKTV